jgi:hypothetical protein
MSEEETDDQYKRATKAVVDDAMRLDVLGPKAVLIFEQYSPAQTAVKKIADDAIKNDKDTRDAIKAVIDIRLDERKIKGISKLGWIGITVLATVISSIITGVIVYNITEGRQPEQTKSEASTQQR